MLWGVWYPQDNEPALDRDIRLEFARPHWEALTKAERHTLLRLSLADLGLKAAGADVGASARGYDCTGRPAAPSALLPLSPPRARDSVPGRPRR